MKKIKLVFGFMLIMILALSTSLMAGTYSGGSGTVGDPYQIANWADLLELSGTSGDWEMGKYFIQTADIDASASSTLNSDGSGGYYGFSPIGGVEGFFSGSYNGQNHTIDALYINRPEAEGIGLFSEVYESTVENLGLTNVNITGYAYVGGLAASGNNSNISDCYVTGSVTGQAGDEEAGWYVGGLVGSNPNTPITNCYTSVSVTGVGQTGGLVGYCSENLSVISYCYNLGNVTGTMEVGGLVGNLDSDASVANCYNSGNITSSGEYAEYVGGLVGSTNNASISDAYNTGSVAGVDVAGGLGGDINSTTINNCYSTGSVTVTGYDAGGLIGSANSSTITNSFWDTETSGQASSSGTETGKTTAEMQTQTTFTNWDFTTPIWEIDPTLNSGYPYLEWQGLVATLGAPENLATVTITASEANLSWDAVAGATIYYIYRSTDAYSGFVQIGTSATADYTDNDISGSNKFFYYITADNAK